MDASSHRVASWLAVARQGLGASRLLRGKRSFPRSAVSRMYFTGYAAAHATLIHLGSEPPIRGNWSHEALGEHLRATLAARTRITRERANRCSIDVATLYNLRVLADYGFSETQGDDAVNEAFRACSRLVSQAERVVEE